MKLFNNQNKCSIQTQNKKKIDFNILSLIIIKMFETHKFITFLLLYIEFYFVIFK